MRRLPISGLRQETERISFRVGTLANLVDIWLDIFVGSNKSDLVAQDVPCNNLCQAEKVRSHLMVAKYSQKLEE